MEQNAFLVRPEGFDIPPEATAIHEISNRYAKKSGAPIELALMKIELLYCRADVIVGHNVDFDIHVVDAEFCRQNRKPLLERKPKICTMQESVGYCNLPNHKYPKLSELHEILFRNGFRNAHNALADVKATYRCFWRLVSLKIIQLPRSTRTEKEVRRERMAQTLSEIKANPIVQGFVNLVIGVLIGLLLIWVCEG